MKAGRFAVSVGLGAALSLAAGGAQAQHWLQDRALSQGSGIRVGSVEVHPGVGAEVGYDSNTLYAPLGTPTTPSLRLRFTPHISLTTLGAQRTAAPGQTAAQQQAAQPNVIFGLTAAVIPVVYLPLTVPDRVSQITNVGGNLGFNLHVAPGRTWQFVLRDDFSRAVQGAFDAGVSLYSFNRIENAASAALVYQSAGGMLEWRLGYTNRLAIMTDAATETRNNRFNRMDNEVSSVLRWRFFPKTSLLWDVAFTPTIYLASDAASLGLFTAFPIRTRLGLNGLLSERVSLELFGGYQGTYITLGDNADTFVGSAEIKYRFGPETAFSFGVQRDMSPSVLGGYYIRNWAHLGVNQMFGGRFYLNAQGGGGIYEYGYSADSTGAPSGRVTGPAGFFFDPTSRRFTAVRIEGRLYAEFRATDWFGIIASTNVSANLTDAQLSAGAIGVALSWLRFEAFGGLRVSW